MNTLKARTFFVSSTYESIFSDDNICRQKHLKYYILFHYDIHQDLEIYCKNIFHAIKCMYIFLAKLKHFVKDISTHEN